MKYLLLPLLAVTVILTPATALAQPVAPQTDLTTLLSLDTNGNPLVEKPESKPKPAESPKPTPVVYAVVEGDNLTKIGTTYNVEWQRLWAKNTQLTNPDLIHVGDQITVPAPDEVLSRDIPAGVSLPAATPGVAPRGAVAGNLYTAGQCTWYVKNRRPDLPNNLGNASDWLYNARAQGMATGSTPRVGAVGWTSGHVVYIESINPDGTVNISDMNGRYIPYEIGHYTYPASKYQYIY